MESRTEISSGQFSVQGILFPTNTTKCPFEKPFCSLFLFCFLFPLSLLHSQISHLWNLFPHPIHCIAMCWKLLCQESCDLFIVKSIVIHFFVYDVCWGNHFFLKLSSFGFCHIILSCFLTYSSVVFTAHLFFPGHKFWYLSRSLVFSYLLYIWICSRKRRYLLFLEHWITVVCVSSKKTDTIESRIHILSLYSVSSTWAFFALLFVVSLETVLVQLGLVGMEQKWRGMLNFNTEFSLPLQSSVICGMSLTNSTFKTAHINFTSLVPCLLWGLALFIAQRLS